MVTHPHKQKAQRLVKRLTHASTTSLTPLVLYVCESWILTEALIDKLEIFAITSFRVILGKESRDNVTDESISL